MHSLQRFLKQHPTKQMCECVDSPALVSRQRHPKTCGAVYGHACFLEHSSFTGIFQCSGQAPLHFRARSQFDVFDICPSAASRLVLGGSILYFCWPRRELQGELFFRILSHHLPRSVFCGDGWFVSCYDSVCHIAGHFCYVMRLYSFCPLVLVRLRVF